MTIKNIHELNEFEKHGLITLMQKVGFTWGTSTDSKTHRTRKMCFLGKLGFEEESMTIEVD